MSSALFNRTIGPFVIGTVLSMFLGGATTTQAITYYENFPNDPHAIFWLVTVVLALDTFHSAISCYSLYYWAVTHFENVQDLLIDPWSFRISFAISGIVAATIQSFYAYRVYIVSGRKWLIPVLICFFGYLSAGFVIAATFMVFTRFHGIEANFKLEFEWGVAIWMGASCAADILITVSLVWYLKTAQADIAHERGDLNEDSRTKSVVYRIIVNAIACNGSTCLFVILDFITFAAVPGTYHLIFFLCVPKLYFNSLLVSLNARTKIQEDLQSRSGVAGLTNTSILGDNTTVTELPKAWHSRRRPSL